MSIEIKVNNTLNTVCKAKAMRSELIKDLILTYGDDYVIQFPDKYQESINEYIMVK
jgi:hypothetical protein